MKIYQDWRRYFFKKKIAVLLKWIAGWGMSISTVAFHHEWQTNSKAIQWQTCRYNTHKWNENSFSKKVEVLPAHHFWCQDSVSTKAMLMLNYVWNIFLLSSVTKPQDCSRISFLLWSQTLVKYKQFSGGFWDVTGASKLSYK